MYYLVELYVIIGGAVIVSALFIYQIYRLKQDKAFDMLEQMFQDAFDEMGLETGEHEGDEANND